MEIHTLKEITVSIGIENPFSFLHISDTHLTLADERDGQRKMELAADRTAGFGANGEQRLSEAEEYAKENGLFILYTGDLIDFVSRANLERAKRFVDDNRVLFIAGNHEFSLCVGEAWEDEAYRNQSLAYVQSFFKEDIRFCSTVVNGVNFVGIDNGYYLFDHYQLNALKEEVAKGYPIILYVHNPLFEKTLFDFSNVANGGYSAYLVGTPEPLLRQGDAMRYKQQKADAVTEETITFIKAQPLIKAVFAGHLHKDFDAPLTENIHQYVTGMTTLRHIHIV